MTSMATRPHQARRAVIIGPGKLGCGYLAPLFARAGWQVTLATRSDEVAARIRAAGEYTVRITGEGGVQRVRVDGAVIGSEAFERAVRHADVVATAVGGGAPQTLGEPLARALAARGTDRPIDVWTVENTDVAPAMEAAVREAAARVGLDLPPVGFAGAIAYPAISQGDWKLSDRPEFVGDSCRWLLVDQACLLRPLPSLPRVGATTHYDAHLEAKRFVFGAGHALCAYLGARRGHRWIHEAAADPLIRPLMAHALAASMRALHDAGVDGTGSVEWVLQRYADAELSDPIRRVARDPVRKLAPDGPLVGPARLVVRATGHVPRGFAEAIASALGYRDPEDRQACRLARRLGARDGLATVLRDVCGLDPDEPLAREVALLHARWSQAEQGTPAVLNLPDRPRRRAPLAA